MRSESQGSGASWPALACHSAACLPERRQFILDQVAEKLQAMLPADEDAQQYVRKYIRSCKKGNHETLFYGRDSAPLAWDDGKPVRSLVGAAEWLQVQVRRCSCCCSALVCPVTLGPAPQLVP